MNRSLSNSLRKLAIETGIIPRHKNYVRFFLLGRSRTGSNLVRGLLNSHPHIIVFGELFRSDESLAWGFDDQPSSERDLKRLQTDPIEFLEEAVFQKFPREIAAVGFKIFYYHAQNERLKPIWSHLRDQTELRILHIKRKNILSTHLSRERAAQTDRWANVSGEYESEKPILLDYEKCLQDFIQTRQWEEQFSQFFSSHPILDVIYEDFTANLEQETNRLQEFLGIPPRSLVSDTHKQSRQPLSVAIANYAELKHRFSGSPWEEFFEDSA